MGKEEGFGKLEFLLWVSKSQALDLVLELVAEIVAGDGVGAGVGFDGESSGFVVEKCGKDCHYHFGDDDCGW